MEDRLPARFQHAVQLPHCATVVRNVIEHGEAQDDVEPVLLERHRFDVELDHPPTRVEIRSDVVELRLVPKPGLEPALRSEVQDRSTTVEQRAAVVVEEVREQPVSRV
jgi:hypothetical protein